MKQPQSWSHYPGLPAPARIELHKSSAHACPYLPDRESTSRFLVADRLDAELYHDFLDAGFRRSGRVIYQPICAGCRECVSIRVPVNQFRPSKSQRRVMRRNQDLLVSMRQPPLLGDEKFELYVRYTRDWHGKADEDFEQFASFLYSSPVDTIEFEYRDPSGPLLAVGICDVCSRSLSSVYFYFDPRHARRGLGTYGALREIAFAAGRQIPYYYLGYRVRGCAAMEYKSALRPNQILCGDGVWRDGDAGR